METDSNVRSEIAKIDKELERIQSNLEELLNKQEELTIRKEFLEQQLNDNGVNVDVALKPKVENWSLRFEWSEKLEVLREKVFHIKEFRPLQRECMNVTMSGIK